MGLWCSEQLTAFDDTVFDCELRAYGSQMAYLCICGSRQQWDTLDSFMAWAGSLEPFYESEKRLSEGRC